MERLRAIIAEKDSPSRREFENLLKTLHPNIEIKALCTSSEEVEDAIKSFKPEIVFLNGCLEEKETFDWLPQFYEREFEIIVVSDHANEALQAIRLNALDYLIRPIVIEELKEAIKKCIEKPSIAGIQRQFYMFAKTMEMTEDKILALSTAKGYEFLKLSEIIRCEASENYTIFHLVNETKLLVSKTLLHFEEELSNYSFFRTHQSHLVNLRKVKSYKKGDGGTLTMECGSLIEVSRRKKEKLLEALSGMSLNSFLK
jgi:two-component system LytT family response regulator